MDASNKTREQKNQTKEEHTEMELHSVYTVKIDKTNVSYYKSE